MKLKQLVVASMSVLGLISLPAFADTATQTTKHKHHHKHHVMAATTANSTTDYKAMGALPVVCPITNMYTMILDRMDQNVGRAKSTEDCMKLISFAGGVNVDGTWGNRSKGYEGENVQRIALNDAYLNVFGNVNDWVKAMVTLSYDDASNVAQTNVTTNKAGIYDQMYTSNGLSTSTQTKLILQQGFLRIANFDQTPFFVDLGKEFVNFGRYQIDPIERTVAQSLTESLQTAATAGFITQMGFNGSIFAFDNGWRQRANNLATSRQLGHTTPNYGAALGFDHPSDQLGYDIGVGYLYDMIGVNDVMYAVNTLNAADGANGYRRAVGAGTIYGDINSGGFSFDVRFVEALRRFDNFDLDTKTLGAVPGGAINAKGARPYAGDLQAGYGFNAWNKNQNIYLGYQQTNEAVDLFLPKNRWIVGYNIDAWKNTNLGVQVGRDKDYSTSQGGTGNSSDTVGVRAAVKFG